MKAVVALLLLVVVACGATAPLLHADGIETIEGSYIVVLKTDTNITTRDSHISGLQSAISQAGDSSVIGFKYDIESFVGFSAKLSEKFLATELEHPDVLYIEVDQVVRADTIITQSGATWGLARTSTRDNGATKYFYDSTAGAGVNVYVIDTGIYADHSDFGGRAQMVFNAIDGEADTDLNGHGTHCAGTIGGTKYGIAKKVNLFGVKVLAEDGSGSTSGVVAGINYVTAAYQSNKVATVASMSLGGGISSSIDNAVKNSINAGVIYSIAAGNSDADACDSSPARVAKDYAAITVGATDKSDIRAYFSNYGECVNIFAPGYEITSDWIGARNSINTISGTSMACPHVSGVLALYLASSPEQISPADAKKWLLATATPGIVADPETVPDLLLFSPTD